MSREEKAKAVRRLLRIYTDANPPLSINETRIILALERAAARLCANPHLAGHLIFKGGMVSAIAAFEPVSNSALPFC